MMCWQEMTKLEDARKMNREAELYLRCDAMVPAKAITTHKVLVRVYRADQARASQAIAMHRLNCRSCKQPNSIYW
jgi:hypothetical protein